MDNLFTGRKDNIHHLLDNPHFEYIHHDIINPISIECDQIYNLACPASPVQYQKDPIYTTKTAVYGALNMLELAKSTGARILQSSTSEVYGNPECSPQIESYWGSVNPIGPRSCYDEGKRVAETLFFDYHRKHDVDIKVVRIFNTYGPGMDIGDGRVISNFIVQALRGDDITIYGDGSQTRSFCYVDDLVEGMMRMMDSGSGLKGPVNIGNPEEITIRQLAEKIIELTGSELKMVYAELPMDDPVQRRPDIMLAKKELGWEPEVDLEDGLQRTIAYFEKMIRRR